MKRKCLLILSCLFLILWLVGLFYTNRTGSIHIALIVGLLFFMRSLMIVEPAVKKEIAEEEVAEEAIIEPVKETAFV